MDRETIIKLAREAGLLHESDTTEIISECGVEVWLSPSDGVNTLERFANLIAQHEREECAKVCDDINAKYKWPDDVAERVASQWCADAIRARSKNT